MPQVIFISFNSTKHLANAGRIMVLISPGSSLAHWGKKVTWIFKKPIPCSGGGEYSKDDCQVNAAFSKTSFQIPIALAQSHYSLKWYKGSFSDSSDGNKNNYSPIKLLPTYHCLPHSLNLRTFQIEFPLPPTHNCVIAYHNHYHCKDNGEKHPSHSSFSSVV